MTTLIILTIVQWVRTKFSKVKKLYLVKIHRDNTYTKKEVWPKELAKKSFNGYVLFDSFDKVKKYVGKRKERKDSNN
ncbi:histidine triad family protein [Ligilactobacillus equi DPC 6820]|uniref:Histidine triad family protein n=1 Tax=Ligilactobacillus equi DPC 6820 TaxID=1392007 RepID=V7HZV8_9LACO|nr:histidine triad family protein [Ligilactobacillus equi DPC 6820]